MTAPRCPLCNTAGSACGPTHQTTPIDSPTPRKKGPDMAKLSNYDTVVNGMPTTLRLTEEDAERRGLVTPELAETPPEQPPVTPPGTLGGTPPAAASEPPTATPSPTPTPPVDVDAPPAHEVIDPVPDAEPTTAPAAAGKRPAGRSGKTT